MSLKFAVRRLVAAARQMSFRLDRLTRHPTRVAPRLRGVPATGSALSLASPDREEGFKHWRRTAAVVLVLALALTVASCSGDDEPSPTPTSTTAAPTTLPTTATPAWEAEYRPEELAAYDVALTRYTAYLNQSQSVWAAGKATPAAKKLFQEYYIPWQAYFRQLEQFEQSNIRIARNADVLDSKATRIVLDGGDASVTIQQCVDATKIGATQNDTPLANAYDTPQLTDVEMAQVDGRWYITQLPTDPKDRPCSA